MVCVAGGRLKKAQDVRVGDVLATPNGLARVQGRTIQAAGEAKEAVVVGGRFIITPSHRIQQSGQWMKPLQASGSVSITTTIALYNFVMEPLGSSILVEDVVVSTLGTFCDGSHKQCKPSHQLWNSAKIATLLKRHDTWPNVSFDSDDMIVSSLKDTSRSHCYLSLFEGELLAKPWDNMALHEIVHHVESA